MQPGERKGRNIARPTPLWPPRGSRDEAGPIHGGWRTARGAVEPGILLPMRGLPSLDGGWGGLAGPAPVILRPAPAQCRRKPESSWRGIGSARGGGNTQWVGQPPLPKPGEWPGLVKGWCGAAPSPTSGAPGRPLFLPSWGQGRRSDNSGAHLAPAQRRKSLSPPLRGTGPARGAGDVQGSGPPPPQPGGHSRLLVRWPGRVNGGAAPSPDEGAPG